MYRGNDTGAYRPPHTQQLWTPPPAPPTKQSHASQQDNDDDDDDDGMCLIDLGAGQVQSPATTDPLTAAFATPHPHSHNSNAPRNAMSSPPAMIHHNTTPPNNNTTTTTTAHIPTTTTPNNNPPRGANVTFTSALARRQAAKEQAAAAAAAAEEKLSTAAPLGGWTNHNNDNDNNNNNNNINDPFAELVAGTAVQPSYETNKSSSSLHNHDNFSNADNPVVRQAQEAALYAEKVLQQQTKASKSVGRWFGHRPTTQELLFQREHDHVEEEKKEKETTTNKTIIKSTATLSTFTSTTMSPTPPTPVSQPTVTVSTPPPPPPPPPPTTTNNNNNSVTISVPDRDPRDYYGNDNGTARVPWYSAERRTPSEADYGLGTSRRNVVSDDTTDNEKGKAGSVVGASVLGGVAGLMLMGPVAGVVAAGGLAYAAATGDGVLGSALRGAGKLVAGAAGRVEKERTASGVAPGVGWLQQQTSSTE